MNTPKELKYASTHEWAKTEGDVVTVGITDFAQDQLGDVVFVELPEVGRTVSAGESVAVVESVKTASDIYSPVSGEVLEVNTVLEQAPETLNDAPYEGGWLFKVRAANPADLDGLLDADAYTRVAEEA